MYEPVKRSSESFSSCTVAHIDDFKSSLDDHIAMASIETLRKSSRPQELFKFALQNLLTVSIHFIMIPLLF